jgi:hypothetical protein
MKSKIQFISRGRVADPAIDELNGQAFVIRRRLHRANMPRRARVKPCREIQILVHVGLPPEQENGCDGGQCGTDLQRVPPTAAPRMPPTIAPAGPPGRPWYALGSARHAGEARAR